MVFKEREEKRKEQLVNHGRPSKGEPLDEAVKILNPGKIMGQEHFSWLRIDELCLKLSFYLFVPWYYAYQMPSGLTWLLIILEKCISWWT